MQPQYVAVRTWPVILLLAAIGCGGGEPPGKPELMVLCGSSFRMPMERLKELYEEKTGARLVLSFGGSEELFPPVKAKAAGDLFVTHDPFMENTEKADAMLRWVQVGSLAPALVVKKGNPKGLKRIEDLAQPGLAVILPDPEYSTCGEMVFALLATKGIKDEVLANVGDRMFRHHGDIGNKMKLGLGDAAIMWNGVAHNFLDAVDLVPTPYEYDAETRVGVIGLSYTKHKAEVEEFLKFAEEHGKAVFAGFGYVKEARAP